MLRWSGLLLGKCMLFTLSTGVEDMQGLRRVSSLWGPAWETSRKQRETWQELPADQANGGGPLLLWISSACGHCLLHPVP